MVGEESHAQRTCALPPCYPFTLHPLTSAVVAIAPYIMVKQNITAEKGIGFIKEIILSYYQHMLSMSSFIHA